MDATAGIEEVSIISKYEKRKKSKLRTSNRFHCSRCRPKVTDRTSTVTRHKIHKKNLAANPQAPREQAKNKRLEQALPVIVEINQGLIWALQLLHKEVNLQRREMMEKLIIARKGASSKKSVFSPNRRCDIFRTGQEWNQQPAPRIR